MTEAAEIEALFTQGGAYRFARWRRAVAPVAFGVDDATLGVLKGAAEAVAALTGRALAETDPELGANLLIFFVREWGELSGVPDLGRLIPELPTLLARLEAEGANGYRGFRFEADGAIRAAFVLIRMDEGLAALPAEVLALDTAVRTALLWSEAAFGAASPLALLPEGQAVLRPEIGAVLRAAYDPVLPDAATDPAHALRLAARVR